MFPHSHSQIRYWMTLIKNSHSCSFPSNSSFVLLDNSTYRFCVRQRNSPNWGQKSERLCDGTVESGGCARSHFAEPLLQLPQFLQVSFLQPDPSLPSVLWSSAILKYMWFSERTIHFLILFPLCEMHFSLIPNSLDSYSFISLYVISVKKFSLSP